MNMKFYEAMGSIDSELLDAHFLKKDEIARKGRARRRSLFILSASSAAAFFAMLIGGAFLTVLYIYGIPAPLPPALDGSFGSSSSNSAMPSALFIMLTALTLLGIILSVLIWYRVKKRIDRKYKIF